MRPEVMAAFLSAIAAAVSAICAFFNWRLAQEARDVLRADERVFAGIPTHPDLPNSTHSAAVLLIPVFNKSSRKVAVKSVEAYSEGGQRVPIHWSTAIDKFGNPETSGNLAAVSDLATIYVRRDDGNSWSSASVRIRHTHSDSPLTVKYDATRWMYEEN